jgi:lipoprotein-releasing system ATP-binding protein
MAELLRLKKVKKAYDALTPVLEEVSLELDAGALVAIVGPSGCGKSTLLNIIGTLDRPSAGTVEFEGRDLLRLNEKERAAFRNREVGFVFQQHHLLPQCTVLENVLIPTLVNRNRGDATERALQLLARVGLSERLEHRPGKLSGGERQRVAVVRALLNRPKLLLADEPTGSLSAEGSDALMDLLLELNREEGMALVVVTHSMAVAQRMGRMLTLEKGRLRPAG